MPEKLTTEEFIRRAKEVHGDKYDYSISDCKGRSKNLNILCKVHGVFEQTAHNHLIGMGCKKCFIDRHTLTTEEFTKRAKEVHGDTYDYDCVDYKKAKIKVKIKCPLHGYFWQTLDKHINRKHGCPKCSDEKAGSSQKSNRDEIIKRAIEIHGNTYNYDNLVYKNIDTPVNIICKIHGSFLQTPYHHISKASGCPICANILRGTNQTLSTKEFIFKANKIHNNKYDYSNVDYKRSTDKVCILCPIHGEFLQIAGQHLSGRGCPKCKTDKTRLIHLSNTKEFVGRAKKVHKNKYNYSKVEYKNSQLKVIIICPTHGEFLQTPNAHLRGSGCSKCFRSAGEDKIEDWLKKHKIKFKPQKMFNTCKSKRKLRFDFYIASKRMLIEFDGGQHFKPIEWFGGVIAFKRLKQRDRIKTKWAKRNNYKLIHISHKKVDEIGDILGKLFKVNKTL
jgi:very-short-patch-repair endonuclease